MKLHIKAKSKSVVIDSQFCDASQRHFHQSFFVNNMFHLLPQIRSLTIANSFFCCLNQCSVTFFRSRHTNVVLKISRHTTCNISVICIMSMNQKRKQFSLPQSGAWIRVLSYSWPNMDSATKNYRSFEVTIQFSALCNDWKCYSAWLCVIDRNRSKSKSEKYGKLFLG